MKAAPALLAGLLSFGLFAATFGFDPVWDDRFVVGEARSIGERGGPAAFFASEYRTEPAPSGYYRPLVLLSLWAGAASALHLGNALLHGANAALLFAVLSAAGLPPAGALFSAALWGVHPVHVEAVAPIAGRVDLLAALFVLLATLAWLRGRPRPRWGTLLLGGAAVFGAGLSKETGLVLPAVLLGWDALAPPSPAGPPGGPPEEETGWWGRNRGWLAAWGAALAAVLVLRAGVARVGWGNPAFAPPPLAGNPLSAAGLFFLHAGRLLSLPWPLKSLYSPISLAATWWTVAGALLAAGTFLGAARLSPRQSGLVPLLWAAAFLLPVSGVVPIGSVPFAERYLYLPAMGFCAALGVLVSRGTAGEGRRRRRVAALALAAILALGALSALRLPVWKDEVSLFTEMARVAPDATAAHNNLGVALEERGRLAEAIAAYRRAVALNPANLAAAGNLDRALRKTAAGPGFTVP